MNPGVIGALIYVLLSQQNKGQVQAPSDPQQSRPVSVILFVGAMATLIGALSNDLMQKLVFAMFGWDELVTGPDRLLHPEPILGLLLLLLIPLVFPWCFTRWYLIPRGKAEGARILTLWAGWAWNGDRFGGSVAAGVWALLRRRTFDGAWFTAQEPQLAKSSLRAGGILAHGLAAAGRGDLVAARMLLASARGLHSAFSPRLALRLAREWQMVEALERGDWKAIHALGQDAGPRTILSRFLFGIAARKLAGVSYRFARLRLGTWWLLSGRWKILHPMLQEALACPERPPSLRSPPVKRRECSLAETLAMHQQMLKVPAASWVIDDVIELGIAWDSLFETPERLVVEVPSLVSMGPAAAADLAVRLREHVVEDLVEILRETDIASEKLRTWGKVLQDVADRRRQERLLHLEDIATRLKRRVEAKKTLPPIDEWLEYLQVRAAHERVAALGGLEIRRLAYSQSYLPVNQLGCWLYSHRDERPIAHAMFRWLLQEAIALDDATAIKTETNNVSLCPDHLQAPPAGWR